MFSKHLLKLSDLRHFMGFFQEKWMFPKIGGWIPPKMDGENNGTSLLNMGWFGGFPIILVQHPNAAGYWHKWVQGGRLEPPQPVIRVKKSLEVEWNNPRPLIRVIFITIVGAHLVCPKNPGLPGFNPMTWGWDWDHQSYSRRGLGIMIFFQQILVTEKKQGPPCFFCLVRFGMPAPKKHVY